MQEGLVVLSIPRRSYLVAHDEESRIVMIAASSKDDVGKMITELQSLLRSGDTGELNVDEDLARRIVHQLVQIAVNIAGTGSRIEDIIDNHPLQSLLSDGEKLLICKSVHILREHPEVISSLVGHQVRSHTCGNYLDSSIRFDRTISQRAVYETEGERSVAFIWRLQLSDSEDIVLRLPFGALTHLAKQCDLISAEINRIRQAQMRQTHPRS